MQSLFEYSTGLPIMASIATKMTLVLAVGWLLHFALTSRNPRWRVLLWRGVMLALIAVLPAELLLPRILVAVPGLETWRSLGIAGSGDPAIAERSGDPATTITPENPAATESAISESTDGSWNQGTKDLTSLWTETHSTHIVFIAWFAVTSILLLRSTYAAVALRRLLAETESAPAPLRRLLDDVAHSLGAPRNVQLRITPRHVSPFLTGILFPAIMIPSRMVSGKHDDLRAVFAHELAHVCTRDPLWMTVAKLLSSLLWFHPFAWRLRAAHESACESVSDGVAADFVGGAPVYTQFLARTALDMVDAERLVSAVPVLRTAEITHRLNRLQRGIRCAALSRQWALAIVSLSVVMFMGLGMLRFAAAERRDGTSHARDFTRQTTDYLFPDAAPESELSLGVKQFSSARNAMDDIAAKLRHGETFPDDEYNNIKAMLTQTADASVGDPLQPYCERRLLILDWTTGKSSAEETVDRLLRLADAAQSPSAANYAREFAGAVALREKDIDTAVSIFSQLSSPDAPQFGWFAFEYSRRYAEYIDELTQKSDDGQSHTEDYAPSKAFADFIAEVMLPKLEAYVVAGSTRDYDGIELDQIAQLWRRLLDDIHHVLGSRTYHLSKRATDELMPRVLEAWSEGLTLLSAEKGCRYTPEKEAKEIARYAEVVIPRIKARQSKYEKSVQNESGVTTLAAVEPDVHAASDTAEGATEPVLAEKKFWQAKDVPKTWADDLQVGSMQRVAVRDLPDAEDNNDVDTGVMSLAAVLTHAGTKADYDTLMGDSGMAFAFPIEVRDSGKVRLSVACGKPWALVPRLEFVSRVVGREFITRYASENESRNGKSLMQYFETQLLPIVDDSIQQNLPMVALDYPCFILLGYLLNFENGKCSGYIALSPAANPSRPYPFYENILGVVAVGARRDPMNRMAADRDALKYAVALFDETAIPASGAMTYLTGRSAYERWKKHPLGPDQDFGPVLHGICRRRESAIAYLTAMASRHDGATRRNLMTAVDSYRELCDFATTVSSNAPSAADIERVAKLDEKSVNSLRLASGIIATAEEDRPSSPTD
ncbi:MAG: M48 family metalloprotease [Candidatus Hydrogenedentes bacterium]|nr:M48 family metalloprotease [Candidatus Hydrogenedentota bacterium]